VIGMYMISYVAINISAEFIGTTLAIDSGTDNGK